MSCHPQRFDPGPDDLSSPFCGLLRYLCRPARSLYSLCGPFADTIGPGRLLPEGLGGFRRWSRARLLPCGIFEVMLLPPFLLPFIVVRFSSVCICRAGEEGAAPFVPPGATRSWGAEVSCSGWAACCLACPAARFTARLLPRRIVPAAELPAEATSSISLSSSPAAS